MPEFVNDTPEPLYESEADGIADRQAGQRAGRSLAATVAKLHGAMPLSAAAQRLLAATQRPDYKVTEVVRIIESDPALASRIIRQVSSALFGRVRCTSIAQAVTMLGARALQTMAVAASAIEWFGDEPIAQIIVGHMNRVGEIARFLARHCGLIAEEMYTCGLLHDLGKLMLLRGGDLDYGELVSRAVRPDELHPAERERYGFDHAVLAGHVLNTWKLPHPLPRIVAWHHQPTRAFRAPGQVPRMVALVRLADHLAYALADPDPHRVAMSVVQRMPEEIRVLGLSEDATRALCAELAEEVSTEVGRSATQRAPERVGADLKTRGASDSGPRPRAGAAEPTSLEPTSESPATEATALESLAVEATGTESPATEATGTESPATEATGTESPATEATALELLAVEATGSESLATEATALESPALEATALESLALEATGSESPALEATALESPASEGIAGNATMLESAPSEGIALESTSRSAENDPGSASAQFSFPPSWSQSSEVESEAQGSPRVSNDSQSGGEIVTSTSWLNTLARDGYALAGFFFFGGAVTGSLGARLRVSEGSLLASAAVLSVAPALIRWIIRRVRRTRSVRG